MAYVTTIHSDPRCQPCVACIHVHVHAVVILFLTVSLDLDVPDNGTCGNVQLAECSARDFTELEIKIDGYVAETFYRNTIHSISIGPVNITRCDRPDDQFRLCLTYVAGEAVDGLQITCSANGEGLIF